MGEPSKKSPMTWLLVAPLKLLWALFVVLVPLLGVWVASSMAAFHNGPIWLVCVAGLLAFPILPLLWELRGELKHRKRTAEIKSKGKTPRDRILTFFDRITLRTLAINLILLTILLLSAPQLGFTSLATRGDWMLPDDEKAPWVEQTRRTLFASAERLEWFYDLTRDDPFARFDDTDDVAQEKVKPKPPPKKKTAKKTPDKPKKGDKPRSEHEWPWKGELHPAVEKITKADEASVASVGRYFKKKVKNPFERAKALHDYVADRIAYDAAGLADGSYVTKQQVETVFSTRIGVCAGYARLMVALGKHTGDEIVYVSGVSRDQSGNVGGVGHAWNAIKIEGAWYLMDVTWDAGFIKGNAFTKRYSTNYFLTPPEVFGINHFPNDESWQLREAPLTRGAFMRQPMLNPGFYAQGFSMLSPTRSQITVEDEARFVIANVQSRSLIASVVQRDNSAKKTKCSTTEGDKIRVTCPIPSAGTWQVIFYSSTKRHSTHWSIGRIEVNSR